jgi:hypothetical protein
MAHSHIDPASPQEVDRYKYRNEAKLIDPKILAKLKKEKIGKVGNFVIYMVDDEYVRNWIDIDFVFAGNFARDTYIPEGEIWISKLTKPSDYGPTLVHEAVESYLMSQHDIEYDKAHDTANIFESRFRRKVRSKELSIKTSKDALKEANKLVKNFLMDAVVRIG